jgi:hypothetical protein
MDTRKRPPRQPKTPRIIWNGPDNPTNQVATTLGIPRWRLRTAVHEIKKRSKLGARDGITIYDDGTVRDANGEHVGDIYEDSRAD